MNDNAISKNVSRDIEIPYEHYDDFTSDGLQETSEADQLTRCDPFKGGAPSATDRDLGIASWRGGEARECIRYEIRSFPHQRERRPMERLTKGYRT